ncbi:MAG: hypothetical protein AB1405_03000 [Bdellovibrionota bacterium]
METKSVRRWLAAALLASGLALPGMARAQGLFGDVFPPGAPDGRITVGDVAYVQLFALGLAVPDGTQIDAANVFPITAATGCGPLADSVCIDFANRNMGGLGPGADAKDITVGDVTVLQLAALGQIKMPPRLNILSLTPNVPAPVPLSGLDGSSNPVELAIAGTGFDPANFEVRFIFDEVGDPSPGNPPEEVACTYAGGGFPQDCADFDILSATINEIVVTVPSATLTDVNGNGDGTAEATVRVTNLATSSTADSPDPLLYADALFELAIVSGDGQASFPLVALGEPLVLMATDLQGNPISSNGSQCLQDLQGCFIQFQVDFTPGDATHDGSLNGEGDTTSVDLSSGFAQVSVIPYPSAFNGGKLYVTATLMNFFGDPEPGVDPITFVVTIAQDADLVLSVTGGNSQTCANGEICPYVGTAAVPLSLRVIDKYGLDTGSTATISFADNTAGGVFSSPAVLTGVTNCAATPPCVTSVFPAEVQITAGTLEVANNEGDHAFQATATVPAVTVHPAGGLALRAHVERASPASIEMTSPDTQAERSVARGEQHAMDVLVRDQFGRTFNGATVNYAIALAPLGDDSNLSASAPVTAGGGLATSNLNVGSNGAAGDLTVTAAIAAVTGLTGGDSVSFLFAIGTDDSPPPPLDMARVHWATPVSNALTNFTDGTNVNSLLVRGALGAVAVQAGDDITQYSVHLTGPGLTDQCADFTGGMSNGLPTGVVGGNVDPSQARFQVTLGSYLPGTIAELRVSDEPCAGLTPEFSLPRTIVLPGAVNRGYITDRSTSAIHVFDLTAGSPFPGVEAVDADSTQGPQAIHMTGLGPNSVAFFATASAPPGAVDRALVVNTYSHDLSLVRIGEEVLVQHGDLSLSGGSPSDILVSPASNFVDGPAGASASRNAACNVGLSLSDFSTSSSTDDDDCAVAPGDRIIIHPPESLEGGTITRTVIEVIDDTTIRISGDLTSAQVPNNSDFRIVSNYREIDADNDPATTSPAADVGISRIGLPTPDPALVTRSPERADSIAIWRPTAGTIPGVTARAYVTDRSYQGLYVIDMVEDGVTDQWSFSFPDTGVVGNTQFLPLVSIRNRTLSSAPASLVSGPGPIAIDSDRALAFVVIQTPTGTTSAGGGVSVIALSPDPAPATVNPFLDLLVRFPGQSSGILEPALCQGTLPDFVGCEVDLDHDTATHSIASTGQTSGILFDCDFDGTADDTHAGQENPEQFLLVDRAGSLFPNGVTFLTPRMTNLPGDWWNQVAEAPASDFNNEGAITPWPTPCDTNTNPPATPTTFRANATLSNLTKDFRPYQMILPDLPSVVAGVRRDVALLAVRSGTRDTNTSDTSNREFQPLYQVDIAANAAPVLINDGTGSVTLAITATAADSPYPIACVGDLPYLTAATYNTSTDNHPRQPDNYVVYPRSADLAVVVTGAADLRGSDGLADTPDDLVFPGDVLVTDFNIPSGFLYRYTVTGLDSTNPNTTFLIRTDRCDAVPGGGVIDEFRVMRTIKIVDFSQTVNGQDTGSPAFAAIQDPLNSFPSVPRGLPFGDVRGLRDPLFNYYLKDFKDAAILQHDIGVAGDASDDIFTGLVTFTYGTLADDPSTGCSHPPLSGTKCAHAGAFSVKKCLLSSGANSRRYNLDNSPSGGCLPVNSAQSNDNSGSTVLHFESPTRVPGSGGHVLAATKKFGYFVNGLTAEVLVFGHSRTSDNASLSASFYPPFDYLGGPGFIASESGISNTETGESPDVALPGDAVPFFSRKLSDAGNVQRIAILNPQHDRVVILEETGTAQVSPRIDDTNNVSGFSSISFPMVFDSNAGYPLQMLDDLVMGDFSTSFLGNLVGFVTAQGTSPPIQGSSFLGVVDFTGRAALDLDADLSQIQGIDSGNDPFSDVDVDRGRGWLVGIIQHQPNWEIAAWDLLTFEEIDLTTERAGDNCQSSNRLTIDAGGVLGGATITSVASRDGLVLIGFAGGSGGRLLAFNTDNLQAANFQPATTTCRVNVDHASVKPALSATFSPQDVQDIVIQGDLAYFVGASGGGQARLGVLDLAPFSYDGSTPRDAFSAGVFQGAPGTAIALAQAPTNAFLNGNLLFVTESNGAGGNTVEVFDVAPLSAAPSGSAQITYHVPQKVGGVSGADVGNCAGRLTLNGNTLFVVDGRVSTIISGSSACDLSGDNLILVDLTSPALSRGAPATLSAERVPLGDPDSEVRGIVFDATPPNP